MINTRRCFTAVMVFLFVAFLTLLLFPPASGLFATQKTLFFLQGGDMFADFFNVMRYLSDDAGFYFSQINELDGHGGFPFGWIFSYPYTLLVDYSNMSLADCYVSKGAMFSCIMNMVFMIFFFWRSLSLVCRKYNVPDYILIPLLLSSVFLFSVERGNFVFISATCVNYYLAFYDAKDPFHKYFSLICICVAATLKGFPVLFGLLLLQDKRYKDIIFCVIFTLIIAFVPFFFLDGGFANLTKMMENVSLNNEAYLHNFDYMFGLHKLVFLGSIFAHLSESATDNVVGVTRIVEAVMMLLSIILALLDNRRWRQLILIACAVLLYPINSGFYCALFLFPVLILFFQDRETGWLDYIIMLLFCAIMNPLQINYTNASTWVLTPLLSNASVIALWVVVAVWSVCDFVKRTKKGGLSVVKK